jgi:hypothetical protein
MLPVLQQREKEGQPLGFMDGSRFYNVQGSHADFDGHKL